MANWKGLLGGLLARILNAKPTADDPPPPALPAPLPIPHGPSDAELRSKPEGYASDAPAGAPSIPCRHCGRGLDVGRSHTKYDQTCTSGVTAGRTTYSPDV